MATVGSGVAADPSLPKTAGDPAYYEDTEVKGIGWVTFAAIALGFAGVWVFFEGLLAIFRSKVYIANSSYIFSDLRTWGFIVAILGLLSVWAAYSVFTGSEWARWFGIVVAALNAYSQLMFVNAQPWWSVTMFAVDVIIIYALAAYGGKRLRVLQQ
jgi:hypothetical protein